jgi:hypothetical protein
MLCTSSGTPQAVSPPEYDRWMTMVCASFARGQVPNSGP